MDLTDTAAGRPFWDQPPAPLFGWDQAPVRRAPKRVRAGMAERQFRLTDRDRALITVLGRYRYATAGQLARRYEVTPAALRMRLPSLEREGLVTSAPTTTRGAKLWTPTEAGLTVARVPWLSVSERTRWSSLAHDLLVGDVGTWLETQENPLTGDPTGVITKREVRASQRLAYANAGRPTVPGDVGTRPVLPTVFHTVLPGGRIITSPLAVASATVARGYVPDLWLPEPGGRPGGLFAPWWAVEVVTDQRSRRAWDTLMDLYAHTNLAARVVFVAKNRTVRKEVTAAVRRCAGLRGRAVVGLFLPQERAADPTWDPSARRP